ncbi:MAG: hypothetical protein ACAI35_09910 [Candidatus Methylacidiphilales bacterium]
MPSTDDRRGRGNVGSTGAGNATATGRNASATSASPLPAAAPAHARRPSLADMMDHEAHGPAARASAREESWKFFVLCVIGAAVLCAAFYLNLAVFNKKRGMVLTSTTRQLILDYEVGGGEAYYNRNLIMPTWPGELSGVTIGVGYDLGYVTPAQFEADWGSLLPADTLARLRPVLGITGLAARPLVIPLSDIRVPWVHAQSVFLSRTLPRFEAITRSTFPGMKRLPADAQGALVSLVFNRGSSLTGERRMEMAAIAQAIAACSPENTVASLQEIARNIRNMKRLWPANPGLQKRRDAEAFIVEKCLPPGTPIGPQLPVVPTPINPTTPLIAPATTAPVLTPASPGAPIKPATPSPPKPGAPTTVAEAVAA